VHKNDIGHGKVGGIANYREEGGGIRSNREWQVHLPIKLSIPALMYVAFKISRTRNPFMDHVSAATAPQDVEGSQPREDSPPLQIVKNRNLTANKAQGQDKVEKKKKKKKRKNDKKGEAIGKLAEDEVVASVPTMNEQVGQHNDGEDVAMADGHDDDAAMTDVEDKTEENRAIPHGRGNKGGGQAVPFGNGDDNNGGDNSGTAGSGGSGDANVHPSSGGADQDVMCDIVCRFRDACLLVYHHRKHAESEM